MKTQSLSLLLFLPCLFITRITAQSECPQCPNYGQFMKQGRSLLEKKDYSKALTEFQAAQVAARACKCNTNAPADYINKVFAGLQQQREDAIAEQKRAERAEENVRIAKVKVEMALEETQKAKEEIEKEKSKTQEALEETQKAKEEIEKEKSKTQEALEETQKAKEDAQQALEKANKITNAFYFYADCFALSFRSNEFYYIDKNGDEVSKLGRWKAAEQFELRGYAKVVKNNLKKENEYLLLDTFGNTYTIAFEVEVRDSSKNAIDLSNGRLKKTFISTPLPYWLKILLLEKNQLKKITSPILELKSLETLDLRFNKLRILPTRIEKLINLTKLFLGGNQIKEIPKELGELKNLTNLDLGGNQIKEIPKELGELKNLTNLDLSGNQIKEIPKELGELKNLTNLDLGGNQIKEIPKELGELKNLTNLDLSGNQIKEIPKELGELKNLTNLDLSGNQIKEIPKELGELKNLTNLDLSGNQIKEIPTSVKFDNLRSLNLSNNQLSSFSEGICNFNKIKLINFRENIELNLKTIIDAFKLFPKRITLTTSEYTTEEYNSLLIKINELNELPIEIGQMQNIVFLDLNGSKIINLPSEIGDLTSLVNVNLCGNSLSNLPFEINKLTKLVKLNLSDNQFKSFPVELSNLINIENLNLSNNLIVEPSEILSRLMKLRYLNLENNNISNFPLNIGNLKRLEYLNLKFNPISECIINKIKSLLPNCELIASNDLELFIKYQKEKDYFRAYSFQKKILSKDSLDYQNWYNLSYYALFVGNFEEAISAAKKSLHLMPKIDGVETNLALGYLLNNEWRKAKKIYLKLRGKKYKNHYNDYYSCDEVFLKDIQDLEEAGISHPDFEKVKIMFKH